MGPADQEGVGGCLASGVRTRAVFRKVLVVRLFRGYHGVVGRLRSRSGILAMRYRYLDGDGMRSFCRTLVQISLAYLIPTVGVGSAQADIVQEAVDKVSLGQYRVYQVDVQDMGLACTGVRPMTRATATGTAGPMASPASRLAGPKGALWAIWRRACIWPISSRPWAWRLKCRGSIGTSWPSCAGRRGPRISTSSVPITTPPPPRRANVPEATTTLGYGRRA